MIPRTNSGIFYSGDKLHKMRKVRYIQEVQGDYSFGLAARRARKVKKSLQTCLFFNGESIQ